MDKRIPAGGGLGGGSADAAAVLRWAGCDDLRPSPSRLGADVPFCLVGGRARVTGIGEVVEPLPPLARAVTLVVPPLAVSTPAVYRAWDELGGPDGPTGPTTSSPRRSWSSRLGRVAGPHRRGDRARPRAGRQRGHVVRRGRGHPNAASRLPEATVVVARTAGGDGEVGR